MAKSKIIEANEKIAEKLTGGYKKIEDTVTGGYKKIESRFIENYLAKDGESIDEARERLHTEELEREQKHREQTNSPFYS